MRRGPPVVDLIAEKVLCDVRTVRRATVRLCGEQTGWFRRELDDKNYCYYPRFERLNEPFPPVDNTGHLEHQRPDIHGGQNVRLSSLIDPFEKENPTGACGEAIRRSPRTHEPNGSKTDDRRRKVFGIGSQDELITIAARAEGKPDFVYYDTKPWRLWNEYLVGQGLPPLQIQQTRQHLVDGHRHAAHAPMGRVRRLIRLGLGQMHDLAPLVVLGRVGCVQPIDPALPGLRINKELPMA